MRQQGILSLLACLALCVGAVSTQVESVEATKGATDPALPDKHYIEGVPFVSWGDAARGKYDHKDVLNPSYPAATQMNWRYWGFSIDPATGKATPEVLASLDANDLARDYIAGVNGWVSTSINNQIRVEVGAETGGLNVMHMPAGEELMVPVSQAISLHRESIQVRGRALLQAEPPRSLAGTY